MDRDVSRFFVDPAERRRLSRAATAALLRKRIKYVFVIFNESESFDHEYGTFLGANGLYADHQGNPRSQEWRR